MNLLLTLRQMWRDAQRQPRAIAVVLVVAAAAGLFAAYHPGLPPSSRQYDVWVASADVLVDTSDSQVVDAKAPDFATLASRASLLGSLLATEPLRTAIAEGAGVDPTRLVVVPPATATATTSNPLPPTASGSAASRDVADADATVLTLSNDTTVPILRLTAQAPDPETASALTRAGVASLEDHVDSAAASESIPETRKLVVRQLGEAAPAAQTRGPSRLLALIAAAFVALLGLAAVIRGPDLIRRWKESDPGATRGDPRLRRGYGVSSTNGAQGAARAGAGQLGE